MKTAEALELMTQKQMFWTRLRQLGLKKDNDNIKNEDDWETEYWVLSDSINSDRKMKGKPLEELKEAIIENKSSADFVV
mgnify:CR=1 FL=1